MIDTVLTSGRKSGYLFRYRVGGPERHGRVDEFTVVARPEVFGKTGLKNLFVDQTGVIRETSEDREATALDPPLAG